MGREFTNALASIPLWTHALNVYPAHKRTLLRWQDEFNASVNDLIALSYAHQTGICLAEQWWNAPTLLRNRRLVDRVRQIRKHCAPNNYQQAKDFELMLEGVDVQLINILFQPGDVEGNIAEYASHLTIDESTLRSLIMDKLSQR
jgi:hypothetical protein